MNVIEKLFELENDEELLSYQTKDNIPIYCIAKWFLLHDILMCRMLGVNYSKNDRVINLNAFKYLLKASYHNLTHSHFYCFICE